MKYIVSVDFLYRLWFSAYSQALSDKDKDLSREAFAQTMKDISIVPPAVLTAFVNEYKPKVESNDQLERVTGEVS